MKSILNKNLMTLALLFASLTVSADIAVVVHPSVPDNGASDVISKVFLGKAKSLPSGQKIVPINLEQGDPIREEFNDKVLNKSESQLKSYWSKLIFTGKGQPPKDVGSEADVIKLVADNPNIIGYVSPGAVTAGVKVLATY